MRKPKPVAERLAKRLSEPNTNGCVEWTGPVCPKGYGWIGLGVGTLTIGAHRAAYELARGAIPAGMVIDHLCRNRRCCNPDHLEAVTNRENVLRGVGTPARNARKTHCKHGHEFTPENTYSRSGGTARRCKTCHRSEEIGREAKKIQSRGFQKRAYP